MDVIEEILTRLPVKHVLRCKLLSKSCYDLIQTPSFIKKHLLRQQSHSNMRIVGKRKNLDNNGLGWVAHTLSSSSSYEGESQLSIPHSLFTILVGSCNGLLAFSSDEIWDKLTVCNPATRIYMSLPKPPLEHMLMSNHIRYCTIALGFAYDAKSGDYKLIKIGRYKICGTYLGLIHVWSMKTNSWKQINPSTMPSLISKTKHQPRLFFGLLVNGILYWLASGQSYNSRVDILWCVQTILSFDPTNDKFGEIAFPKQLPQHHSYVATNVFDFMGSLALSVSRGNHSQTLFDIWVMGSGSNTWTKRFSIGPFPRGVRTTQMCINGNFVLYHVVSESVEDCKIILYDPHCNEVVIEVMVKGPYCSTTAWSLTESLVSVSQPTSLEKEVEEVNKLLKPPLLSLYLGLTFVITGFLLHVIY